MNNPLKKSYYKYRIVLTFSLVSIFLVAVLARVSYVLVKELYLEQISTNVKKTVQLTADQLNRTYIGFLDSDIITKSTKEYFTRFLSNERFDNIYSEIFIINENLKTIFHSNIDKNVKQKEPRLLLNQPEIFNLQLNTAVVSLPFKGDDDKWYLWGFFRLSDKHWLVVKESANNFNEVENLSSILWYFGLIGILVSLVVGIFVANSITKPVRELVKFSDEIGLDNLSIGKPKKMKGELNILAQALDKMRKNIHNNQKEKEKILAQIAHEIRNPLGGIELLTNLISEKTEKDSDNYEYTQTILKEINELKKLINSYLNYSKPSKPVFEKVDINAVVEESVLLLKSEAANNQIEIVNKIKNDSIKFDRTHLKNVLVNLIKNSIESINNTGNVTIKSYSENNTKYITISDDGKGIPNENLNKVFEPFFTTKSDGTGLGLATSKKYCEDNNAKLYIEQNGKGCKFIISKEIDND